MNNELENVLVNIINKQKAILAALEAQLNDLRNPRAYSHEGRRSAAEWCKITGIEVLDPDGWDRADVNFMDNWNHKPISHSEFKARADMSTCSHRRFS